MPHFENLKLYELRSLALQQLDLSVDAIRQHGDLGHRQTWIDAIASISAQPVTESLSTAPLSEDSAPTVPASNEGAVATCAQNGYKFTLIQNEREFSFVEGQLIPHGVPVAIASRVSTLAESGRWAEVFQIIHANERATRILQRIQEVQAA